MPQRRMFSLVVTDTDSFLELPISAQALYFHLGMHGDDDGFVNSPKRIMQNVGCNKDDLSVLIAKNYVIPFESGVVVIRDWNLNNTLKNDRYHATLYSTEKAMLYKDEYGRYSIGSTVVPTCIQSGSNVEPELNVTKQNKTESFAPCTSPAIIPPTLEEIQAYIEEKKYKSDAKVFYSYYERQSWMIKEGLPITNWKAAVDNWENRENNKIGSHKEVTPNWIQR